jgi:hypothetical protein
MLAATHKNYTTPHVAAASLTSDSVFHLDLVCLLHH